jgi:hypothetical protein
MTDDNSLDFDEDVPHHRRMTVTRVIDHAELADSVLNAPSAPTINISPMSPQIPVSRSFAVISEHQQGGLTQPHVMIKREECNV